MLKINSNTNAVFKVLVRNGARVMHRELSARMIQKELKEKIPQSAIRKQLKGMKEEGYVSIRRGKGILSPNRIMIKKELDYKEGPEQLYLFDELKKVR